MTELQRLVDAFKANTSPESAALLAQYVAEHHKEWLMPDDVEENLIRAWNAVQHSSREEYWNKARAYDTAVRNYVNLLTRSISSEHNDEQFKT